jgi:hypothetical protein
MVSAVVGAINAGRPASSSNRTQPNAQRSERELPGSPRTCSGLMYAGVPSIIPGEVTAIVGVSSIADAVRCWSADLAKPKSRILTSPSGVTLILAGLMSRCAMPR